VVARDQFGRVLSTSVKQSDSAVLVQNVTLTVAINPSEASLLTLDYSLPRISQDASGNFDFNLDLFPYLDYYAASASVTVVPPEGATIVEPKVGALSSATVTRDVFQQN
jgi:hypothetical protein